MQRAVTAICSQGAVRSYHRSTKATRGVAAVASRASPYHDNHYDHASALTEFVYKEPTLQTVQPVQPSFDGVQEMPEMLASRNCLVTNCQRGVDEPEKIAHALAKYGANVIVHAKSSKDALRIRDSLPVMHPGQKHHAVTADLSTKSAPSQLVDQLQQITGSLEVVVHNAALPKAPPADVVNCAPDDFNRVIDLNLKSPFALTQSLLPLMAQAEKPSIIFASNEVSANKDHESSKQAAYYVNKFGLKSSHMLTSMLSQQLETVRVNAVDPTAKSKRGSDSTKAFVWLAREDTELTGSTLLAQDWIKRDPSLYTKGY